jgi:hypothetical protein
MDWDVVAATAASDTSLRVSFRDGLRGEVAFAPSFFRGAFAPLADPRLFRQVSVDDDAITWPGDLDLAPDALHRSILATGSAAKILLT